MLSLNFLWVSSDFFYHPLKALNNSIFAASVDISHSPVVLCPLSNSSPSLSDIAHWLTTVCSALFLFLVSHWLKMLLCPVCSGGRSSSMCVGWQLALHLPGSHCNRRNRQSFCDYVAERPENFSVSTVGRRTDDNWRADRVIKRIGQCSVLVA